MSSIVHRLTPRNCPLLTNQSLSESQPWFEMLVRIQEITRDLSGTKLLRHQINILEEPSLQSQTFCSSSACFDWLSVVPDPGLVFQASLTSAQVLLPGSQASLSSLLLEGHSLLVLAAVMFAPGGIDQVKKNL